MYVYECICVYAYTCIHVCVTRWILLVGAGTAACVQGDSYHFHPELVPVSSDALPSSLLVCGPQVQDIQEIRATPHSASGTPLLSLSMCTCGLIP